MIQTEIKYFGEDAIISCDGKCNKAWGIVRPEVQVSEDPDDFYLLSDHELGKAPACNGNWEDGHGKPANKKHNKWCARQCERSVITAPGDAVNLPDLSKRMYNLPARD